MTSGFGLHTGAPASVRFHREPGPLRLRAGGVEHTLAELVPDGASRSTTLLTRGGERFLATVEHLFAALEARSIRSDLVIEIDGPEVPLVDGGAATWADALAEELPAAARLVIARPAVISVGTSEYRFTPGAGVRVAVTIDFADLRIAPEASWDGDPADFRARIATARTFGFAHELEELLARGLASHVSPTSVVVLTENEVLSAGAPFTSDEPARHKVLDLLGDLYVHGGAPLGVVHAIRPGHAATHEAMRRALAAGVVTSA